LELGEDMCAFGLRRPFCSTVEAVEHAPADISRDCWLVKRAAVSSSATATSKNSVVDKLHPRQVKDGERGVLKQGNHGRREAEY
jgi:hypothetical protein